MTGAPDPKPMPDLDCPYPGLRPFRSDETHLFFGRARQVGDMLPRLETRRFLAVVGVSGCGKSSLVRAGLIPAVRDGWLAARATDWRIALMRPGSDPFAALAEALLGPDALGPERAGSPNAAAFLQSVLRRGRLGLREAAAETGLPPDTGLLLVVDQFEEVFRFRGERREGRGRDDADAFVDLLLASARTGEPADRASVDSGDGEDGPAGVPIRIVITMRSDFLGDCAIFTGLPEAIDSAQALTPRLTRDQYEAAIREPARLRGAELDPDLIARLLNDMGEDPDRLPVLQHALMRMWTAAAERLGWDRRLTLADYPEGGLNGALSAHCDEVYRQGLADDEARRISEVMFRALCERTGSRRDTRRPQRIADIAAVAGVPPEALYPVIEAFRRPDRSFLTPPSPEPLRPRTMIDIAHESLIAQWDRLGKWIGDETESAAEYQRLADATRFHASGDGGLLAGPDLTRILAWREHQHPTEAWARRYPYSGRFRQAMAFLERSQREAEAERIREQEKEAELKATRERELAAAQALAAARERELVTATALASEQEKATREREAAKERELATVSAAAESARAAAETAEALAEQRAKSARNMRRWLVLSVLLVVVALGAAWSALNAKRTALENEAKAEAQRKSALESRAKWFMEVADHGKDRSLQSSLLMALEAGRAAPQLVQTETVLRLVLAGISSVPLMGHEGEATAVAFAPDGRTLASGSSDGTIRLWDPTQPGVEPRVLRGHEDGVSSVAFAPDGRTMASGSEDGTVRLWDLAQPGVEPLVLRGHEGDVSSVAFAPDGRTLASGSSDGTVRLWDLAQPGVEPRVLRGHEDQFSWGVSSVAFAPDGRTLASGSSDKTVRLWDLAQPGAEPRVMRGHEEDVWSVAFAPDGRTLASGSGNWGSDANVRLWDLTQPGAEPRVLRGHEAFVTSVAFAPDGRTLASGSGDRTIRLWDLAQPGVEPRVLRGHEGWMSSVAFAPDGRTMASGSEDGTVRLWDLAQPQVEPRVLRGHEDPVTSVAFAPDGRTLASGSGEKTVRLWDLAQLGVEPRVLRGHEDRFSSGAPSVAFAPDGRTLASGSGDKTVRLWDLAQPGIEPRVLRGHEGSVSSVAFAPDGRTLASGSKDGTVRLWDLAQPGAEPQVLRGDETWVESVGFAPDGRTMASGSADGTVRLWDLDLDRVRTKACGSLSRNLSAEEWRRYFGDEHPLKTCPKRPIHPSFFEPGNALAREGKLEEAIAEYQRVLDQFGSRELYPGVRARRLAAPWKRAAAVDLAERGDVAAALAAYAQANEWDPQPPHDAMIENDLCWYGSLWGRAADVLAHCQRAVELDPGDVRFKDSRALARAQTGDLAGALEDFNAFVAWAQASDNEEIGALIPKRLEWIDCLEQGVNPFDDATLEALRRDEL